jgi:hypothetical protein
MTQILCQSAPRRVNFRLMVHVATKLLRARASNEGRSAVAWRTRARCHPEARWPHRAPPLLCRGSGCYPRSCRPPAWAARQGKRPRPRRRRAGAERERAATIRAAINSGEAGGRPTCGPLASPLLATQPDDAHPLPIAFACDLVERTCPSSRLPSCMLTEWEYVIARQATMRAPRRRRRAVPRGSAAWARSTGTR